MIVWFRINFNCIVDVQEAGSLLVFAVFCNSQNIFVSRKQYSNRTDTFDPLQKLKNLSFSSLVMKE